MSPLSCTFNCSVEKILNIIMGRQLWPRFEDRCSIGKNLRVDVFPNRKAETRSPLWKTQSTHRTFIPLLSFYNPVSYVSGYSTTSSWWWRKMFLLQTSKSYIRPLFTNPYKIEQRKFNTWLKYLCLEMSRRVTLKTSSSQLACVKGQAALVKHFQHFKFIVKKQTVLLLKSSSSKLLQ